MNNIFLGFIISILFILISITIFNKTEAFGATSPGTLVQLSASRVRIK